MHLTIGGVMQVDRIGYYQRTSQYLVFLADSTNTHLEQLKELIEQHCPQAISPRRHEDAAGRSIIFDILPQNASEAIPKLVQRLQSTMPSTATWLKLDYLRAGCRVHHVLTMQITMAPCLPLRQAEDELQEQLDLQLQKHGIPQDFPFDGEASDADMATIRAVCSQFGIYAQGVVILARIDTENACLICSKQ